ncbi:MAG: acyl-CoA dehydrogenase family protein [Noviherbaspirillum sp.]
MTDDARLIADSAIEFAKGSGGLARARTVRDNSPQFDQRVWQQIAELGWLSILVPERLDGLGLGVQAMCALLESVGRTLLPEPLVSAIAAGGFLVECGSAETADLLAELTAGRRLVLAAPVPSSAAFPLRLSHVPDCYDGATILVAHGDGRSFEVRVIEIGMPGTAVETAECVDGSLLSELVIGEPGWSGAHCVALGTDARAAWEKTRDVMQLGYSAFLVGLMDASLEIAIDYMQIRKQFGTAIGTFQALQHRAASAHVDIVSSRALLYEACTAFATGSRARAACAAKARASAAALRVTKECIQFHGAIGFADEHDIGLYLRKAMTIAARQGGEMQQKLRYSQLT